MSSVRQGSHSQTAQNPDSGALGGLQCQLPRNRATLFACPACRWVRHAPRPFPAIKSCRVVPLTLAATDSEAHGGFGLHLLPSHLLWETGHPGFPKPLYLSGALFC
ncbi:unnamed protein product [Gulo gulo]|uniref:Uncharacterized protein n=1 Tax=Gulo gulo TaxID=48420 RepID=A0A9X9Q6N6_GULGU|nr:unnamed protein product [Gulo gulo]